MDRRAFLQTSALLAGWFLTGCPDPTEPCWSTDIPEDPSRRVFSIYQELASLDYFDLGCDGRLRTVVDLPPILDVHTHLGFAFLDAPPVPLNTATGAVDYLFDPTLDPTEINLDDYSNRLATDPILDETTGQSLAAMSTNGSSRSRTHTIPNLLREMDDLGIARSVVLPIVLGLDHEHDDAPNVWMDAILRARTDRILPFGSVHPDHPDWADRLRAQAARGVYGVKVHPVMQQLYPDDERLMAIYALADELGLPVLTHAGRAGIEPDFMAKYAHMEYYEAGIAAFPNLPFILAHSGAYLDFEAAMNLADTYDNVWVDLAGPGVGAIQTLLQRLGPERILFGTDWPFFTQALDLAKVLLATEGDDTVRAMLLHQNAERLLGVSSQ